MRLVPAELLLPLLFKHYFKARPLFRRQDGHKFIFGLLQLFADLRSNRFHELFGAFLAGADDFVNLLALVLREVQLVFGATQQLDPHQACLTWHKNTRPSWRHWLPLGVWLFDRVSNQQPASDYTGPEDDDRGKNYFPGVHQVESEDWSCSTAASTVFSMACERSLEAGFVDGVKNDHALKSTVIATQGTVARHNAPAQKPHWSRVGLSPAIIRFSKA